MSPVTPPPAQGPNDWAPPVPPPAPPAPRKSWFARHKILTGLLALVLLGSVSSALGGGGDTAPVAAAVADQADSGVKAADAAPAPAKAKDAAAAKPEAKAAEPAQPEAKDAADAQAGVGTAVRDGEFEFTVTKVKKGVASVGSRYLKQKAQGQYVILNVTVKNIGEKPQLLSDSEQKVRDGSGREFSTDSTAGIYIEDNKVFFSEINPGNSVKGQLVFDMPKGAKPATVELHDSLFSDGVSVSLS